MRDTPETDAVCDDYFNVGFDVVDADFARKLERERDDALKELDKKYIEFDKLFDEAERIRNERDKALEELVGFKNYTKYQNERKRTSTTNPPDPWKPKRHAAFSESGGRVSA